MLDIATLLPLSSQLKKLYSDACRSVCLEFDLTQTEFEILDVLSSDKGHDTSAEIAKLRLIKKANVSTSVERLITKGYVTKMPDCRDKRVIHLRLTDKASLPVAKIKAAHEELLIRLSDILTGDELDTLTSLIDKLTVCCNTCLEGEA